MSRQIAHDQLDLNLNKCKRATFQLNCRDCAIHDADGFGASAVNHTTAPCLPHAVLANGYIGEAKTPGCVRDLRVVGTPLAKLELESRGVDSSWYGNRSLDRPTCDEFNRDPSYRRTGSHGSTAHRRAALHLDRLSRPSRVICFDIPGGEQVAGGVDDVEVDPFAR